MSLKEVFSVRFSDEELALIKDAATKRELGPSVFIRRAAVQLAESEQTPAVDLEKIIRLYTRISEDLAQLKQALGIVD